MKTHIYTWEYVVMILFYGSFNFDIQVADLFWL